MKLNLMLNSKMLTGLNEKSRSNFILRVNEAIKTRFDGKLPESLGGHVDHIYIGLGDFTHYGVEEIGKGNQQYVTRLLADTINTVAVDTIWKQR